MTFEERQRILDRIVTGYALITSNDVVYKVEDIRPKTRQFAQRVYDSALEELIESFVPTEQDVLDLLMKKGIWTKSKDVLIKDIQEQISELKMQAVTASFQTTKRKELLAEVEEQESALSELLSRKNGLLTTTAEYISRLEQYKTYIFLLTYDTNGQRLWEDFKQFRTGVVDRFISRLISDVYFTDTINEKIIRELARSEPWKSSWVAALKTGSIFSGPSTEWTDYQKALSTWSIIYDSCYESMDPPSEEIIENDYLFDGWLKIQSDKRKKDLNKGKADKIMGDGQEVGVVVDSYEDALNIYNLNDPSTKGILKSRSKAIKDKGGVVDVMDLPDVKREIKMLVNQQQGQAGR